MEASDALVGGLDSKDRGSGIFSAVLITSMLKVLKTKTLHCHFSMQLINYDPNQFSPPPLSFKGNLKGYLTIFILSWHSIPLWPSGLQDPHIAIFVKKIYSYIVIF